MQPRRGLPPRPSVPPGLQTQDSSYLQNVDPQQQAFNIGAMAAQVLTSSLANPYGQMSSAYSYTNANFHSYFTQGPRLMTTPQGYTFSSTYVPNAGGPSPPQSYSWPQPQRGRIPNVHSTNRPSRPRYESQIYTPGDSKCTYDGCSFIGSKKTVEIHMMDRHLIFPPGWKKKTDDWDADPALKGKLVPIPGTGVTLNTPEAIEAWITERKRRWPSTKHVEEKKRKAQEAIDRGVIDPSTLISNIHKRRKVEGDFLEPRYNFRGRGKGRGGGRGSDYGRPDSGWRGRGQDRGSMPSTRNNPPSNVSPTHEALDPGNTASSDASSSSEESDSDMDPVKDAVSSKVCDPDLGAQTSKGNFEKERQEMDNDHDLLVASTKDISNTARRPFRQRKAMPHPRALLHNPFATRPSLLRNLLLPEIRHTVSNLSQAIHFLVENDFLEGVELKPGDADSERIKVLDDVSCNDTVTNTIQE